MPDFTRRDFLGVAAASAAAMTLPRFSLAADDPHAAIQAEIVKRHAESVARFQDWVKQPSIAAENRSMAEGCQLMMKLAKEAGFQKAECVPTDGHPSVFATLDAGAPRTYGVYFMYDVKQGDGEWSSPPFDAALVDKPGFGKVLMGRGAVNQKGPQAAFLAALHAMQGAGKKLPVNLVLVAEGEEEIGSPHFKQVVTRPDIAAALKKCTGGVFMPSASQDADGGVTVSLGAKGVVELELVSSGAKWGRGPTKDVHSSNRARLDSPAFHLVQALNTLVTADGDPAIEGFADKVRPPSAADKAMLDAAATRISEATAKKGMGVTKWAHDQPWRESLERFLFTPTVNIEGLVAGWTGPGGKTVLPTRAVAKLDLRLVPDMTFDGAVAAIKAHLARKGFADIEVNPSGGYDPTSTSVDAPLIQAEMALLKRSGLDPVLWPRNAGSYPGYVFTGEPLKLPAAHFGLGHGAGAHAPDEYFVIESTNPKIRDWDGAVRSHVDFLYELAATR